MWPILLCSVAAFALAIERFVFLFGVRAQVADQVPKVLDRVKRNQIKEAVQFCENSSNPLMRVLKAGIVKYDRPRSHIREALEDASLYEIPVLEKNLALLAAIAHTAPLLGLLGTTAGLTRAFFVFYHGGPAFHVLSSQAMAQAAWQSLLSTTAGLCVAVAAFAAYNCLVGMANALVLEMEKSSVELVNMLSE
jgi:biopolymer transport protein ExbB